MAVSDAIPEPLLRPFVNGEGRLRAPWRIAVPVVGLLVAFGLVAVVLRDRLGVNGGAVANQSLRAAAAVGALAVWGRYVDRRPLREYGFALDRSWGLDFLAGAAIATAVHGGALATLLLAGWTTVEGWLYPGAGTFLVGFVAFAVSRLFVAVWEESLFRALFLTNAAEGLAGWFSPRRAVVGAWVVSSVVFGVLHLNQAPSAVALSFWILLGLVLGLAYALTGELGLPMGFHFAYNFAGINVFNVVSADPATAAETTQVASLVRLAPAGGPPAFVGLAGWVNVTWGVAGGLLVVGYVAWRHGLDWEADLAAWSPSE